MGNLIALQPFLAAQKAKTEALGSQAFGKVVRFSVLYRLPNVPEWITGPPLLGSGTYSPSPPYGTKSVGDLE